MEVRVLGGGARREVADREGGERLTESRRELVVSGAFAVWGLAIAIALISVWTRPAPPGQLPGLATALNFDAHGSFRWVAGLALLPILLPFVLRPVARRLTLGRAWARNSVIAATLVTLWIVTTYRHVGWAIVPNAIVIIVCVLLRDRDLRFTRADGILFLVFLTSYLSFIDIARIPVNFSVLLAALLVFVLRIVVGLIPSPVSPALAFLAAPLGLILQTSFFARDQRYFGWHALAVVIVTPLILRLIAGADSRRWRRIIIFAVYPIALYAYTNAMSLTTAEGKPRNNFFEDGHFLLPASEYLSGERPYRDTLPAHGLIEDGGFDWLAMKISGASLDSSLKTRFIVGNLGIVALYALAFAVTGSAEGALFAAMLSVMTGSYTMQVRLVTMLVPLALMTAAVRWRRPQLLAAAGFATVVCCATSLDYGFFTLVTLIIAVVRNGGWKHALVGISAAAIPLFLGFAIFGIFDDFFRGTFLETPTAATAYTLQLFSPPERMQPFPDVLTALLDREVFGYLFWCAMAVTCGVMITRPARGRRLEPLFLLVFWSVVSVIAYAERHHIRFGMLAAVVIVFVILRLLRQRSALAIPAIAAAIALASPSTHMAVVGWMRTSRGPVEAKWTELTTVPRARGALMHERDINVVESVRRYISLSMQPDETFFDFSNHGILYFLLRRDCPIREYEVAFYESESQQREVIRRLEANPKVRAAFVPTAPRFTIDGVPNATRAPLVWEYLQTHFEPDFEEGEVVMWRRK
jgi:hypothetical protein